MMLQNIVLRLSYLIQIQLPDQQLLQTKTPSNSVAQLMSAQGNFFAANNNRFPTRKVPISRFSRWQQFWQKTRKKAGIVLNYC